MKSKSTRSQGNVGEIIAIPLRAARFAYGKLLKNCGLGVYDLITTELADCIDVVGCDIWFCCHIFDNAIKSGKWKIIGFEPFANEESAWPPPTFHRDVISGEYEIRHKGKFFSATARQAKGLDPHIMYFPDGLLERIEAERDNKAGSSNC